MPKHFAFQQRALIAVSKKIDRGAMVIGIIQTAGFVLLLWCTPSLILLACLTFRPPTEFD
jgi:hypothetical protein